MPKLIAPIVEPGILKGSDQPTISIGGRLELRPFSEADAPVLVAAFSIPDIRFYHFRSLNHDEALQWVDDALGSWATEKAATWAISDLSKGEVVGRVTLYLSLAHGYGEVSYWVLPDARGRGVATRACVAATAWGHELGLHRIELQHSLDNDGSRAVAQRAQFVEEGVKRQAQLLDDGWHDMVLYSHLATDQT